LLHRLDVFKALGQGYFWIFRETLVAIIESITVLEALSSLPPKPIPSATWTVTARGAVTFDLFVGQDGQMVPPRQSIQGERRVIGPGTKCVPDGKIRILFEFSGIK